MKKQEISAGRSLQWQFKRLLIICLVLFGGKSLIGYSRVDSLEASLATITDDSTRCVVLNNIALALYGGEIAEDRSHQALALAKGLNNPYLLVKSYTTMAWVESSEGIAAKSKYLDSAIAIAEAQNNQEGLASIYNTYASILINYESYNEAIDVLKKAYGLYDELGMESGKAVMLNNWGVILNELGKPMESLDKTSEALNYRETENPLNLMEIGRLHFVIGKSYELLDQPENAVDHYLECYKYRQEIGGLGIFEPMVEIPFLMIDVAREGGDTTMLSEKIRKAGFINSSKLIDLSEERIYEIKRDELIYRILEVRREKALLHGNYKVAYELLERQKQMDEEGKLSNESLAALVGMKSRLEKEQLKSQLLEEELRTGQRDNQIKFLLFFLGLMGLTLIIGILVYQNRLRRKQLQLNAMKHDQHVVAMRAALEGQERERARVARDLHDGLGNLLSTVKITVEGLSLNLNNDQTARLEQANTIIDEACSEVRKISHEIMPQALQRLGLTNALADLVNKVDSTNEIKAGFSVFGQERKLDDHTSLMLFRIAQELLNNAIKYSKASQITVQLTFGDDVLDLTVEDDGVGFNPEEVKNGKGMGLQSIAFRAEDIQAEYELESKPGQGTMVGISLPLHSKSNGI